MTDAFESLQGHLLIAMPQLHDGHFTRSVNYVFEHTPEGALALTINVPSDVPASAILEQLEIDAPSGFDEPVVLAGGPVSPEQGFVIFDCTRLQPEQSDDVLLTDDGVGLSTSLDTLRELVASAPGNRFAIVLGYSGWAPGQLEQEIADNSWMVSPVSPRLFFDVPIPSRWQQAAEQLGIDMASVSGDVGHA